MSEEEQESNTPLIGIILFMLLALRPEEGYMRMIEYIIQSPKNITSYEIQTLLPFFIIIPLIINRKRVSTGINKFVRSQIAKSVIHQVDEDGDEMLSRDEYQGLISMMKEDLRKERKTSILMLCLTSMIPIKTRN